MPTTLRRRFLAPLALAALLCTLAGCVTFDDAPHPPAAKAATTATTPRLTDDRYITRDGTALPLRTFLPAGQPRSVVLALHGFNDYSNAFTLPAPGLVSQQIAVYAYDQRGFGGAPDRGLWAGGKLMAADAAEAARLLRRRYPGTPLYLLGESMGAAVAILAATSSAPAPVDGIVLVAPAVWGRQTMNVFERAGLWLAGLVPSMQFSRRTLPIEVEASDNIPMLRALGRDPLVIKETRADTLNGLVDLMGAALDAGRRLTIPTLVLYGRKDEIVPRGPVARFVEELPAASDRTRQRVALYPQGYHMLLRDLDGGLVVADVAAWLRHPVEPLPSHADLGARFALTGQRDLVAAR